MNRSLEMAVFAGIVDAGSFVAAADALGMSKAAVSRHMSALESRLGVRLLHRTTRKLSLTEEGQIFLHRAREILGTMEEAESIVSDRALLPTGKLRINAPVSFGISHLAGLWAEFLERYPDIELDISLNDRAVDLVEEGYDLAIRISTLPSSSLVCRRLSSTRMTLCASPDYLARHGMPSAPQDLARHRLLAYALWQGQEEWPFHGPEGPVHVRVKARVHSNNGNTCRMIALDGGGIALEPSFIVRDDIASGALVALLPEYRSLELGIYAVYPTRRQLSPKVRAMIDYLAASLLPEY